MISRIFLYLVSKGRIFFGEFFLAPVLSQLLHYFELYEIMGIPSLLPCLFLGFFWGLYADNKEQWF